MAEEHLKRIKIFHGGFDDEDIDICRFEKLHWTAATNNEKLLELLFKAFNAPNHYLTEEEQGLNKEYRAQKLRSLSVGDIVQLDGRRYKCLPVGWEEIQSVIAFRAESNEMVKHHGEYITRENLEKRQKESRKSMLSSIDRLIKAKKGN